MSPVYLPDSLARVSSSFRDCFSAKGFEVFQALLFGYLMALGSPTVCGLWQAAGFAGVWHHCRAHRFFSQTKWCPDELGLCLAKLIIAHFVPAGAVIRLAVDESMFARIGKRIFGVAWFHDGKAQSGRGGFTHGHYWVVLAIVVELPFCKATVSLPVLSRLRVACLCEGKCQCECKGKNKHRGKGKGRGEGACRCAGKAPSVSQLAGGMISLLMGHFPDRMFEILADRGISGKEWPRFNANGAPRARIVTPLKKNTVLQGLPAAKVRGQSGSAQYGARLASLDEIAQDESAQWETHKISYNGRSRRVQLTYFYCCWPGAYGPDMVIVVLVRRTGRKEFFAILCTDPLCFPEDVVSAYASRWSIEVAFKEAKQELGVGAARNRTKRAVQRTVPLGFIFQSIITVAYALHGEHEADLQRAKQNAPWQPGKDGLTLRDIIASLRFQAIIQNAYAGAGEDAGERAHGFCTPRIDGNMPSGEERARHSAPARALAACCGP